MLRLARQQAKEKVARYFADHPNATLEQVGKVLVVNKQRAQILLKLLCIEAAKELTQRELSILQLVAKGYSNRQIGDTLGVSESTIKNQFGVILAKLSANNRAHAVVLAMQQGLISLNEVK